MTNTMTMQEQIEMSGLEIMSSLSSSSSSLSSSSSSSSSSQLQWNSTNQWSPLFGGGRRGQACVTIKSGNENGAGGQTILVIGGQTHSDFYTNSVIVWDPSTKRWRNGPSLNDRRRDLVVVVCRDKVYAIGGLGHAKIYNNTALDTIESIQVSSLLETTGTSMTTRQNNNQWTRLQCRLSSPRLQCAAVVVHNRYIVILGGRTGHIGMWQDLSSVDNTDTAPPHNNNNSSNGEPTIVAGPRMNLARSLPNLNIRRPYGCSMVTLSDCLLVLGRNNSVYSEESLALTVYQKHECCFKFVKFLIEIEFLGRPTRNRDV